MIQNIIQKCLGWFKKKKSKRHGCRGERIVSLPVNLICPSPYQHRQSIEEKGISVLVMSIRTYGVIVPILARPYMDGYQLVSGERRLMAVRQLGIERIPAIVRQMSDEEAKEISFVENFHRENLKGAELFESSRLAKKLEFPSSTGGQEKESVNLPTLLRKAVELDMVSFPIAIELAHIMDNETQLALIEKVYKNKYSTEEVRTLVGKSILSNKEQNLAQPNNSIAYTNLNQAKQAEATTFAKKKVAIKEKEKVAVKEKEKVAVKEKEKVAVKEKDSLIRHIIVRIKMWGLKDEYVVEIEKCLDILTNESELLEKFGKTALCQLGEFLAKLYIRQQRVDKKALEIYEFVYAFSKNKLAFIWLSKAYIANKATSPEAKQIFNRLLELEIWNYFTKEEISFVHGLLPMNRLCNRSQHEGHRKIAPVTSMAAYRQLLSKKTSYKN